MIIKWQVTEGPELRIYFKISAQKDQRGIVKVQVGTRMRAVAGKDHSRILWFAASTSGAML